MTPQVLGMSVIGEYGEYSERVKQRLSYQEAILFCKENHWKLKLYGREFSLRIVRDDFKTSGLPELMKYSE